MIKCRKVKSHVCWNNAQYYANLYFFLNSFFIIDNSFKKHGRNNYQSRLTVRVCGRCDFKGDGVHIRRGPGRAVSCVRRQSVWISLRPAHLWELQGTQTVAMREDMREDMVFFIYLKMTANHKPAANYCFSSC